MTNTQSRPEGLENPSGCVTLTDEERRDLLVYLHQDTGWQAAGQRLRKRFPREA